jgi:hypothetical protein
LVGLAWLEGESLERLGVWAAEWDGAAWRDAAPVAAPARGAQLALTGAVLADDSWLLAWSAFDGEDDEVVWSRRGDRGWSAPAGLPGGEQVPDVTPAARADGDGALLVWSRFDRTSGEYLLVASRLAAGRWTAPRAVTGPGTLAPSWEGNLLLFRDARHGAWVAGRLDDAVVAAVAARHAPAGERPALLEGPGGPSLRLPSDAARPLAQ